MIVLDTHAWLWWTASDPRLSRVALQAIESSDEVGIPAVCCWEVSLLVARGRIGLRLNSLEWIREALRMPGARLLSLSPEVAVLANTACDALHRDPVDRIVVATAIDLGWPLATADQRIQRASLVRTIW